MKSATTGDEADKDGQSSHRREFFAALAGTLEAVDIPQYRIADRAGLPESSVSCYRTGRRMPNQHRVELLYKVTEEAALRQGVTLPYSLQQLLRLHEAAAIESVAPSARVLEAEADRTSCDSAGQRWSALSGFRKRRHRRRGLLARHTTTRSTAPGGAPVPPRQGDRRTASNPHAAEVADFSRYVAEGKVREAHFIAWAMGSSVPALEFPQALASYRKAGAVQGVEAMLNAATSASMQRSVNVAAALLDKGQVQDARAVLSAVRTEE